MNIFKFLSKKDLLTASAGSIFIKFSSTFLLLLNSVILARLMTVEGFGYYTLIYSTIIILSIPVTLGLPFLITKYVSKYDVYKDYSLIKGIIIATNKFAGLSIIVIYILAILTYYLWWNQYDEEFVDAMVYGLILLPIIGLGALRNASLKGLKFVILSELPDTFLKNALFTLFLLFFFFFRDHGISIETAMLLQIIAAAISFIVGYVFFWKKILKKIRSVKPRFENKKWFKEALPFSVNRGIETAKNRAMTYILAIYGNVESVAIFEIAMKGASLITFLLDALNLAIAPYISSAYEKLQIDYIQKTIRNNNRIIFTFSIAVTIILVFGGQFIITKIFGSDYRASYTPLIIICIGQLINVFSGPVGMLLNMTGFQKIYMYSNLFVLVFNVIISIPLVIMFDVSGAATALSLVLGVQNILLSYFAYKMIRIRTFMI